jgi:Putative Actinobacterial Holin-X, holin superfamily III
MNNDRSVTMQVNELKQEFSEFVQTRVQMLRAELNTKLDLIKMSAPLFAVAAVLGGIAALCLTGALICVIAMAFDGTVGGWALACLIVGVCYMLLGGIAGFFAYREISAKGLAPTRTMKVLKQDQVWLANEARSAL